MYSPKSVPILEKPLVLARLIWLVSIIAPALIALIFICRYGVNVPIADQWDFVAMLEKAYAGKLSMTDLFSLHNEHRIMVPRVFMLMFAVASNYDTLIEMYFSWLLLILCVAVVFKAYDRRNSPSQSKLLRFVPAIWLMFSLRQYENFLWGWQITFLMTALAVVLTFYFLESTSAFDKYYIAAICSGLVASFSSLNGLLVWPIGLLQIWTNRRKVSDNSHNSHSMEGAWVFVAISVYVFYFTGYAKPPQHPGMLDFVGAPIRALIYLFCLLGNPLGGTLELALVAGFLIFATAISVYFIEFKHSSRIIISFWDSLILFTLSTSLMLVVGRSALGVPQALESRYTTFTILGIVALYFKSSEMTWERSKLTTAVRVLLLGLIVQGIATSFITGVKKGEAFSASRRAEIFALKHLDLGDENSMPKAWFRDPKKVRLLTPFLVKNNLSLFNRGDDAL